MLRVAQCLPEPKSVMLNTKATRSSETSMSVYDPTRYNTRDCHFGSAHYKKSPYKMSSPGICASLRCYACVSPPSSAGVKNERSYTFTSLACLHRAYGDNFVKVTDFWMACCIHWQQQYLKTFRQIHVHMVPALLSGNSGVPRSENKGLEGKIHYTTKRTINLKTVAMGVP